MVLNAAGPWAEQLLKRGGGVSLRRSLSFSRDAFFAVGRPLLGKCGLALQGASRDPDALFSRGGRHLFVIPWRGCTLFGVWHVVHEGSPDEFRVTEKDLRAFIGEINAAYPDIGLTLGDISGWNAGLVLFGENRAGATDLSYGKRSIIVDHAAQDGIDGLITMIGVRYTTARGVAEKAVDLVYRKLGKRGPRSVTAETPIWGGRFDNFSAYLRENAPKFPNGFNEGFISNLIRNYGSEWSGVMKPVREDPRQAEAVGESSVIRAEVVHAVREEMAMKLADVVFRRTDLGHAAYPGPTALKISAEIMALELGWNQNRVQREISETEGLFPVSVPFKEPSAPGSLEPVESKEKSRINI
jgi:glycerol-3-phosphate dehydrogenase